MSAAELLARPQTPRGERPARNGSVCFGGWRHTMHERQLAEGAVSKQHTVEI